ncbi:hypothetical protein TBLA_0A05120 [Henningerozyma blattae CBS 6284]|uniref:SH3 domain-containing protein n=1 Tax=Henningerozyma blattae (strain ATCC 34711 / CBS 6284 / DSM 70876 / NBRC 10599 / NRRL Y-10934 / UCD 77-7) TaxID=1071380 RepID=I2GW03_HENB6|nr:hypothetical protein TBLA_0A05120 [Tetrapisispora blattae CBS 6284]CCH58305.1 hypothetical protein TBLA_0A05120 [Tetrapisispora blattae CBS 6284]
MSNDIPTRVSVLAPSHMQSSNSITTSTSSASMIFNQTASPSAAFEQVSGKPNSGNSGIVGLAIGLPIGIFCICLILVMLYFYFKKSHAQKMSQFYSPRNINNNSQTPHSNWISEFLYGNNTPLYSSKGLYPMTGKDWAPHEGVSAKIKYHISQPVIPEEHIQSPRDIISKEKNKEINQNMYLNNTSHISKKFIRTPRTITGQYLPSELPLELEKTEESLDMTMARWFQNGTTYIKNYSFALPTALKTPTIQLKKMNFLNNIEKGFVDLEKDQYYDERSPILSEADTNIPSKYDSLFKNDNISSLEVSTKHESITYGTIKEQVLEIATPKNAKMGHLIDTNIIDVKNIPKKKKKSKRRKKYLESKPLPLTPNSKLIKDNNDNNNNSEFKEIKKSIVGTDEFKPGAVCRVVEEYSPILKEEIHLYVGEFVKILTTHTDGWCIVEKCHFDGSTKTLINFEKTDISGMDYLNEDRGIVPGKVLRKYNPGAV